MEIATKTQLQFEPGASQPLDLSAVADVYTTPAHFQPQLADLAELTYLRATWAIDLTANQASAAKATIQLLAGATVVDSTEIDLNNTTRVGQQMAIDVSTIQGASKLSLKVSVTTAGAAGDTAVLRSWLDLQHPLVISNC